MKIGEGVAVFVDEIPRTPSLKISRAQVKELLAGATTGPAREPIVGGGAVVRLPDDAGRLRAQGPPCGPGRAAVPHQDTDSVAVMLPSVAWAPAHAPPGPV